MMDISENHDIVYALAAPVAVATHAAAAANPDQQPFYAARNNGLYVSFDHRTTWTYAYRSFLGDRPLPTLCAALSPAFERDHTLLAGTPGAVLISRDRGKSWNITRFEEPAPIVSGVAFSPDFERDGTAFLITLEDGVYCTYDSGGRWTNWNFGLLDANGLSVAVSPDYALDRTVFAGTSSGLFRSGNGGKSWQGVDLPGGYDAATGLAVSPDYARDRTLFAGTEATGLYRSTDGGASWERVGEGIGENPVFALLLAPDFAASGKMAALVGQSLMLSEDRGMHFEPWLKDRLAQELEISAVCAPEGLDSGSKLFVGAAGKVVEVNID